MNCRQIATGWLSLRPQTGSPARATEHLLTTRLDIPVPTRVHALVMGLATLLAAGVSWGVSSALGADPFTVRNVLIACALGAVPTFAPVVLRTRAEYWGVAVMAAGVGRILVSLGYCYVIRENSPEILTRPLFVGVVSGAFLLLVIEVTTAVKILAAIERRRSAPLDGAPSNGKAA